ncbi:ricin-type beta-trefoil lectin domain protein [Streptomyces halobius]|uniref:RICIN domain-containing protein n=1 Tax=Streptomyces halobius TaxID=2879846 RepID=A0ABY4M672_9ACTN|nr:ricin-type beta-trefoil lectin domain protein [Streptomyces halobius]UQA91876.1 RICIN domain-containing protein [Streptomyces halobius]
MAIFKRAAVALSATALLGGGLLLSGTPAAADAASSADVWYTFQNVGTDRNLDAFGNGSVLSWTPDATGTQDFDLRTGALPGYQIASKHHPGKCATAKGVGKEVSLESCNSNVQAQYWNYNISESGAAFQSRKFSRGCIQDNGNRSAVSLRPCTGAENQMWMALAH